MSKPYKLFLAKAVKRAARLRGGGSALPGLFIERIYPNFLADTLSQLPRGVVVISGTNGKTTTTKMVVELLESQGLTVFTNRSGSNFTRGVASSLLETITIQGELHADIAVLELDEAHAVHFVRTVKPTYSLLLNVLRDQLDRFGEIDTTARLLEQIAESTTDTIVVNREDPRLAAFSSKLIDKNVVYFGLDDSLLAMFPSDDDMRGNNKAPHAQAVSATATLTHVDGHDAVFQLHDKPYHATLKLDGVYNVFNATAALALTAEIVGSSVDYTKLIASLEAIRPAFGRGETLLVNDQPLELVLVKNPSGFRLGLSSFDPTGYATMVAINDNYADGRDMSWLWDVDFDSLKTEGVASVSGVRAYDMALRLQYDEVEITHVDTDLKKSLRLFIQQNSSKPKRIFCTYTAMLALRKQLSKITKVERI